MLLLFQVLSSVATYSARDPGRAQPAQIKLRLNQRFSKSSRPEQIFVEEEGTTKGFQKPREDRDVRKAFLNRSIYARNKRLLLSCRFISLAWTWTPQIIDWQAPIKMRVMSDENNLVCSSKFDKGAIGNSPLSDKRELPVHMLRSWMYLY